MKDIDRQWLQDAFKRHQVTFHQTFETAIGRVEMLRWQEPEHTMYLLDYIVFDGHLLVKGDWGEAVYRWYKPDLELEWITTHDIGYFHEKCKASEAGHIFRDWDRGICWESVERHFKDHPEKQKYLDMFKASGGEDATHWHSEWLMWLASSSVVDAIPASDIEERDRAELYCSCNGEFFFGKDWQMDRVEGWGWTIHQRAYIHLEGLKAAFRWLKENEKPVEHTEGQLSDPRI